VVVVVGVAQEEEEEKSNRISRGRHMTRSMAGRERYTYTPEMIT
jgi:hypothetical protein